MKQVKAGGSDFHRLFVFKIRLSWLIFLAAFLLLVFGGGYLFRALWFDEVLMISNFALLESPLQIYRSYFIPNNQIVHTVLIHWLIRLTGNEIFLRLFSVFCGLLTVFLLWRGFRKKCGSLPLAAVLWTWMISPPFMLYATAIRGYMLAALAVTLALLCGRKYAVSGKNSALAGWFAASLAALGVMPSALAGIAAAGLYILPLSGRKFYRRKRFFLLASAPFAAFLLFYLPIWDKLSASFALQEGWHDHLAALAALAVGVCGTFNVLLPAAAWAAVKSRRDFRKLCYLGIWLLPLGSFLLPAAPFPRVWFVLFPVWAVVIARGIRKNPLVCAGYWIVPVVLAAAMNFSTAANAVSPWCSRAGQDDFFAPYFLRKDFSPEKIEPVLKKMPFNGRIYMPLSADPWAVWWSTGREVLFDSPRRKITALADGTAVIIRRENGTAEIISRFGGRLQKYGSAGAFDIYLWQRDRKVRSFTFR